MEQIPEVSNAKRAIQLVALFFILIVLPLGTVWYTSGGSDYFKELIGELHDYREIPAFEFTAHNGQVITKEKLKDKLVISAFFSLDDPKAALLGRQLRSLHEPFDDKDEVLFLLHTLNPEEDSVEELQAFAKAAGLTDEEQFFILTGSQEATFKFLNEGFKWPVNFANRDLSIPMEFEEVPADLKMYPYFVVADTRSMIKNYYDFEDNKMMGRFIEHLALMLPSRTDDDPELVREKEK